MVMILEVKGEHDEGSWPISDIFGISRGDQA